MKFTLSPSARLALIYFAISSVWIMGSGYLASRLIGDRILLSRIEAIKGMFFITVCALLIFFISRKYYRQLQRSYNKSKDLLDKYIALHEVSNEGIADYDLQHDCAMINEQFKNFLGLDSLEVNNFSQLQQRHIHPSDYKRVANSFRDTLVSAYNTWQSEFRCLWHDNTYHEIIIRGYLIRDNTGNPLHFICTVQDVFELRNIQAVYYEERLKVKKELGKTIIYTQEQERNRWAIELHDNVCQLLSVVKLYLSEDLHAQETNRAMIRKSQELVEQALNEIRQLSASVKPPEFGFLSLQDALGNLTSNIKRVRSFRFILQVEELREEELLEEHKLMIYRVVQEQLNNIIKYANPDNIHIRISNSGNMVDILIADDGKGFDTTKISAGIGLRNIKNRLQAYSGKLKITSAPGKGCTLAAQFFLN